MSLFAANSGELVSALTRSISDRPALSRARYVARPLSSGGRRRVARYRMSTTSSGAPLLPAGFFGTAASDAADITSIGARTFAMPGGVETGPVPALSPAAGESLNPD